MSLDATANIVCPSCGYDLRGRASDRCPECGLDVADIESRPSAIPWVHRRKVGRIRAYLSTVLKLHGRYKWMSGEMARPVDANAARSFRRFTAVLLTLMLGALGWAMHASGEIDPNVAIAGGAGRGGLPPTAFELAMMTDVALPWLVGIRRLVVVLVAIGCFAALWTGIASLWFHPRSLDFARRTRATWLSLYASALLLVPILLLTTLGQFALRIEDIERAVGEREFRGTYAGLVGVVVGALSLGTVASTIWSWTRLNKMLRATCDPSWLRVVSLMLGFVVMSAVACALTIGGIPWLAGYLELAWRSGLW